MPHRSIVRIPKNKNITRAGNTCVALILYFIILIIFRKYWIIINATIFGLIITGATVISCLKADFNHNSDESCSISSDSEEEIICQAEVVLDLPPPSYDNLEINTPSEPHISNHQPLKV